MKGWRVRELISRGPQIVILLAALLLLCGVADRLTAAKRSMSVSVDELPGETFSENVKEEEKVKSVDSQIVELINIVSSELGMDKRQVSIIFELADSSVSYDSAAPDIYNEECSREAEPPLVLKGAHTEWKRADFIRCANLDVERPSSRYLPDALYSIAYDLQKLTNERHQANIGSSSVYYNSLNDDTQDTIDFYEAVLLYIGEPERHVDSFKNVYEKILTDKDANENVVEVSGNKPVVRKKFKYILKEAKIRNLRVLNTLAVIFSHDSLLFKNDNIEKLTDAYVYPYEIGLRTRENMMIAAMSLVGDVRYIWGGGHSGAAYIKGINPVWKQFDNLYPSEPFTNNGKAQTDLVRNEGFGTCIKPSGSWCPIHGYVSTAFHGGSIYSLDQYIKLRSGLFDKIDLTDDKYRTMLSSVNYSNGVNTHVLDGLDCSGYVSWLFNQIQNDYNVNTAARYFIGQSCFTPLEIGDDLLPGDIFAWETHIVVIVGRVKEDSKAYVTLEETPNVLRFGVAYYIDADQSDINYGKQIAAEANSLIGGLNPEYEKPHVYCINTVGVPVSENKPALTGMIYNKKTPDHHIILTSEEENGDVRVIEESGGEESDKDKENEEKNTEEEKKEDTESRPEDNGGGYSHAYDTIVDGAPYKLVYVFMPRGYPGTAEDLGAPAEGKYDYNEIIEKEEGFYGKYYIRLSEDTGGKAGHSADKKKDGFKIRNIYMPRDYEGSMSDFDIPDEDDIDHKEVIEREEGFYATYYIRKKKHKKDEDEEEHEEEESTEEADDEENKILRVARFIEPYEDEGVALSDTGKAIEDMDAADIIRHTLKKLPISMINGYNTYDGDLFSTFSLRE